MHQEKLTILFVISTSKTNKRGLCPLNCRITFNKDRKQFSTGLFINPIYWQSKLQTINKKDVNSDFQNSQIQEILKKIQNIVRVFQLEQETYKLEDIYQKFRGKEIKNREHILSYYKGYLQSIKKLIGLDIKENTFKKFEYVCMHLGNFIKWKYNSNDYLMEELNLQFLDDFSYYLRTVKHQEQVTINKTIQRFRTPIKIAISQGFLDRDPFLLHKAKKVNKAVVFLTLDELHKFESHNFTQCRLSMVQDLFIFCCYTGLAYNEMSNLQIKNLQIGFDQMNWIQMKREKTQRQISVPILPKAQKVINKYLKENCEVVLPKISNQKFNSYLKEMAEIIGIDKKLTHHTARKTFASTVLLYNDVPMEIVSELLGHSKMSITQEHYGKIVQSKVSEHMQKLLTKLS